MCSFDEICKTKLSKLRHSHVKLLKETLLKRKHKCIYVLPIIL